MKGAPWSVYIVRCADGSLYTGVARDATHRVAEHNGGRRGAKYTRSRRPVRLAYLEPAGDRSTALKREAALKKLGKGAKETLVREGFSEGSLAALRAGMGAAADPGKKRVLQGFFKTGPGEYGEGDVFLGITVPKLRALVKAHGALSWGDLSSLMASSLHEERLIALLILVGRFEKGGAPLRKEVYDFYRKHLGRVNNWDLVDASAPAIVGGWLAERGRGILDRWARSKNMWERRIAVVATLHFIRRGEFEDTLRIAGRLLGDGEDLLHKAAGWMLREVGKRDEGVLEAFLEGSASRMPRTMLRYAIERFPEKKRKTYLGKGYQ